MNLQHAMTSAAAALMLAGCGGMSSDTSGMGASSAPGMSASSPPAMGGQSGSSSSSSSSSMAQMQSLATEQVVRLARQSSESGDPFGVDGDVMIGDDSDDADPVAIDAP